MPLYRDDQKNTANYGQSWSDSAALAAAMSDKACSLKNKRWRKPRKECEGDQEVREARREYDAERRLEQDKILAARMQAKLMEMFPGCQEKDAATIARHTSERSSGRVGRSEAGRNLDEEALRLAAFAYIRHRYTNYDSLLMKGMERSLARSYVQEEIDSVMDRWQQK
jgi:hypothetical protein